MRLYGIVIEDAEGYLIISEVSPNIEKLDPLSNIYYTDKIPARCDSVYDPNEDEKADWMPYNAKLYEYGMFYVNGEWYYEGEEPDGAIEGMRVSEYKESKLINKYYKSY